MKKLYLLMMMAPLLCMQLSYAQKIRTSKNENGTRRTVQVSEGYTIKELGDDIYMTYKEHTPSSLSCKEAHSLPIHSLTITFEGNALDGFLSNGEEIYYPDPDFQGDVSEGYYDLVMMGETNENYRCYLIYDQLHIISDTTFNFSTEEAVNKLTLTAVDENGTDISELDNIELFLPSIYLSMHYSIQASFYGSLTGQYLDHYEEIPIYFNDFGDRCSINTFFQFTTTDSKYYFILQDAITEGLTSDTATTNHVEDMVSHPEYFQINEDNPDTLHLGWTESAFYHLEDGENNLLSGTQRYTDAVYVRSNPLTVITNSKLKDSPQPGDIDFMIEPFIYFREPEFIPPYWTFYDASLSSFEWALNSEGKIVKEPFGFPHTTMTRLLNENYTNITPLTPAVNIYNPEIPIYYGYRVPILYYQANCYNESNSPYGNTFYGGSFAYLGEGGLQRYYDLDDILLNIDVNGNVVSQDTMNLFTSTNSDPGIVHMSASNSEVHAYNVTLTNITDIEFDLNKEDAMPPTLTILRVMDQDGKENINILDLESSKIEIAAGDFSITYDEYNNPYKMLYIGKPSIEFYWSTDGQTYTQMEVVEKENMFHVSYGNFFEVSLAPLTGLVNDQWVSLKIIVTDEAGNFQRQELTPLFYVGDLVGLIEKPSINALSHRVYPNPFSKTVTIKVEKPINGNAMFEIYDAMGKIISQRTINCIGKTEFTWDENANTGMYFYKIYTNEGVVQGQFVKQE